MTATAQPVSVLGIGGQKVGGKTGSKKKRSAGEIRIQKGKVEPRDADGMAARGHIMARTPSRRAAQLPNRPTTER